MSVKNMKLKVCTPIFIYFTCIELFDDFHFDFIKFWVYAQGGGSDDENNSNSKAGENGGGGGSVVNLEDYRPIDPVPSSKASIRPGPIQHGTPFLPYIPKPSPPPDTSMPSLFPQLNLLYSQHPAQLYFM